MQYAGRCHACQKEGHLVDDHCHEDGYHRGFICPSCNVTLGKYNDDCNALELKADQLRARADVLIALSQYLNMTIQ